LRGLFGTSLLLAFLPFTRELDHDFFFEPANPRPTSGQILQLTQRGRTQAEPNPELKATISQIKESYKGKKLKFNNKIFVI
jgi:hypothetical protein